MNVKTISVPGVVVVYEDEVISIPPRARWRSVGNSGVMEVTCSYDIPPETHRFIVNTIIGADIAGVNSEHVVKTAIPSLPEHIANWVKFAEGPVTDYHELAHEMNVGVLKFGRWEFVISDWSKYALIRAI